jgi:REP element-mobilizing transposase RayT
MVRTARIPSPTGVYHVMLRGINRQTIFEEDEDSERFLTILSECKDAASCRIIGYCLMGNHAHILIDYGDRPLGDFFRRVATRYASWFNKKYGRIGHLFQDRYRSEPIVDDRQLLTALRYIHQNPTKAGLCKQAEDYRLSSYHCYAGSPGIVDTDLVLGLLSTDREQQGQAFKEFMLLDEDGVFIEDIPVHLTDRQCKEIIEDITGTTSATQFQALSRERRDDALRQMRKKGMSIRQIVRLTGVPFGVVRNK